MSPHLSEKMSDTMEESSTFMNDETQSINLNSNFVNLEENSENITNIQSVYEEDEEKCEFAAETMKSLFPEHSHSKFIRIRRRYPSIRVRMIRGWKGTKTIEKSFCIRDYENVRETYEEAERYRKRMSKQILSQRPSDSNKDDGNHLGVRKERLKKTRIKPDVHGCIGTTCYRRGYLYYEVFFYKDNKTHTTCFRVPNSDMDDSDRLAEIKLEALEFAMSLDPKLKRRSDVVD